jgi:hypothetical protein
MARTLPDYEVIVSNVGTVYGGPSKQMAEKTYYDYIEISRSGRGRAGGEEVSLLVDGAFVDGYVPDHKPWGHSRAALSSAVRLPKRRSNPNERAAPREYYRGGSLPVSTPTRAARLSVSLKMKKLVGFEPEMTAINEDGSVRYWAEWPNGKVGRLPAGTFSASEKKRAYNSIYLSTVSRPTRSDRLMVDLEMEELVGCRPELTVINEDGSARYWVEWPNGKVGRLPKGTFDADFPSGRRYPRHR